MKLKNFKNIVHKKIIKIFIITIVVALAFAGINIYFANNTKYELKSAKLVSEKKVFSPYEAPKFRIVFGNNKTASIIKNAFASKDPVIEARFTRANDNKTLIEAEVSQEISGTYLISFAPTYSFKPGKYTLSANLKTAEGEKNFTQDFTWGVLALNPDKAVYRPSETANISIGVLDERGEMVCDANVELKIKNEEAGIEDFLSTKNGKIKVNKECYSKDFTLNPDYQTSYQLNETGSYRLTLTATTKNGAHVIEDSIKVSNNISFDIKRTSATRVYPHNKYPMIIDIKVNEGYKGYIDEEVPTSFAIIETKQDNKETDYAARIIEKGEKRVLRWQVDWKKGESYRLSYIYDTPDISPEFYIMGNLQLINSQSSIVYSEGRFWQIANDAFPTIFSTVNSVEGNNTTSSDVDMPAGAAAGDLLIGLINADSGAGGMTWPGAWVEIKDVAGTGFQFSAGYLIATGSGTETTVGVTHTTERSEHIGIRIAASAWHGTTAPEISTGATGNDTSPNPDSLTPSWGTADTLWIALAAADDSVVNTVTGWPTNYADNNIQENITTSAGNVAMASRGVNATSEDPDAFTISATETWSAFTLAVRPAAASTISISGNVYNPGTTTAASSCDANAGTFELSLRTNGATYTASCSNTDGSYTFTSVTAGSAGSGMVVWINDLSTDGAIAIRYDGTGDSTLNTFYGDTVTITSDDTNGVTNAIMNTYDADTGDVDIPYVVTSSNLTASSGAELLVKIKSGVAGGSTVYAPGGTVTTNATGGDFHIDDNSAASLDTATSAVGRDILIDTGATLTISASTTVGGGDITATGTLATSGTPTVTIRGTGNISGAGTKTIYNLTIGDGTTATTTLTGALSVSNNASVGTGSTFNINANLTVTGSLTNTTTGIINHTANFPVVTVSGTSIGGGSGAITFYRLQKAGAGTTTFSGSGTNTINNTLDATAGTLTLSTTNVITVAGNVSASTSATLNQNTALTINGGGLLTSGSGLIDTTAGTGTVTISGTGNIGGGGTVAVYNLTINGAQTLASATTSSTDVSVATGATLALGSQNLTVNGGDFTTTTTGTITCSGCSTGTVTISTAGSLGGGSGAITFYNLTRSGTGTTTFSGSGTNTVQNSLTVSAGTLTIANNLTIGSSSVTNSGGISVSGTLNYSSTPTITIVSSSAGSATIGGSGTITFYNLSFLPAVASGPTFTLGDAASQTLTIDNDLTIGNGSNGVTVTALNNNPIIDINGSLSIATSGIFTAPPSASFTIAKNMTNNGTFNNSSGTVTFDTTNTSTFAGSGNPAITFYNFTSSTSTKILSFTQSEVFRINGAFTVTGASIQSTTSTQWQINLQGTSTVSSSTVTNSGCAAGTSNIGYTDTNGGNNGACWAFLIETSINGNTRIGGNVRFQ